MGELPKESQADAGERERDISHGGLVKTWLGT
jgi:hypothetical protein